MNMGTFGRHRFHEFQSGRSIKKQIGHDHDGTDFGATFQNICHLAAFNHQTGSKIDIRLTTHQLKPGNGCDTGQSLAAKTKRRHIDQILRTADFTGCMTQYSHTDICFRHPRAIVAHPDFSYSACLNFHFYTPRSGIQRIFNQFLDYGRRPVYHFTGCDFINGGIVKQFNNGRFHSLPASCFACKLNLCSKFNASSGVSVITSSVAISSDSVE